MPKNSESVMQIINKNISDRQLAQQLSQYGENNVFTQTSSYLAYDEALKYYDEKQYDKALSKFQQIVSQGGGGADLHSDMAITYYHLGKYKECIAECQNVLQTGETQAYAHANYNAALAYEALGNPTKALLNYQLAMKRNPENKVYPKCVQRLLKTQNNLNETPATIAKRNNPTVQTGRRISPPKTLPNKKVRT